MLTEKRIDAYADVRALKIVGIILISVGLLNLIIGMPILGNENFLIMAPYFIQIVCGFIIYFKCVGNAERASGYAGLCMSLEILLSLPIVMPLLESIPEVLLFPFSVVFTLLLRVIAICSAAILLICSIICILEVAYNTFKVLVFTSICVGTEVFLYLWIWHTGIELTEVLRSIMLEFPSLVAYAVFIIIMTRRNVLPPTQFRRTKMNSEWLSTTARTDSETVMFRYDLRRVLDAERKNWKPSKDPVECELDVPLYRYRGFTHLLFIKYLGDEKMHLMVRIKDATSYLDVFSIRVEEYRLNGTIDDCSMVRFYGETGMYVDVRVVNYGEHRGGFIETIKAYSVLKRSRARKKAAQAENET